MKKKLEMRSFILIFDIRRIIIIDKRKYNQKT